MSENVTVGIDGSRHSIHAAEWAAREAELRGLPLCMVHAQGDPRARDEKEVRHCQWADARLLQASLHLRYSHPHLRLVTRRLPGAAVRVLAECAAEAATLVLGSQGLGRAGGAKLGSVMLETVGAVRTPVVIVRSPAEQEPADDVTVADVWTPVRGVVLGLELGSTGAQPVTFAFETAMRRKCPLRVLYAWSESPDEDAAQNGEHLARRLNASLLPWRRRYPSVNAVDSAVRGSAVSWLAEFAEQAGLLVVGRRIPRSGQEPTLGPVPHAVLQHCPSPVAIVADGRQRDPAV